MLARIFEFECRKTDHLIFKITDFDGICCIYFRLYTYMLY